MKKKITLALVGLFALSSAAMAQVGNGYQADIYNEGYNNNPQQQDNRPYYQNNMRNNGQYGNRMMRGSHHQRGNHMYNGHRGHNQRMYHNGGHRGQRMMNGGGCYMNNGNCIYNQ